MIPELSKRIGVESERAVKKAQEYERLLQLKTAGASGFHQKGVAPLVVCIDFAANDENISFDKEMALKLSGIKKPAYNSLRQTIKQVLGLNKEFTIKDLCVQLGCAEVVAVVENVLELYQKQSCNGQQELDHPGFKAAAIMAVSKVKKLGVDRARLHESSGLKKTVFDKLVASMVSIYQQVEKESVSSIKPKTSKRSHSFLESVEIKAKAMEEEASRKNADSEVPEIDFAAWKKRMLEESNLSEP